MSSSHTASATPADPVIWPRPCPWSACSSPIVASCSPSLSLLTALIHSQARGCALLENLRACLRLAAIFYSHNLVIARGYHGLDLPTRSKTCHTRSWPVPLHCSRNGSPISALSWMTTSVQCVSSIRYRQSTRVSGFRIRHPQDAAKGSRKPGDEGDVMKREYA